MYVCTMYACMYVYKVKIYGRKRYVSCKAIISAMAINKVNLKIYHYSFTNKNYNQITPINKTNSSLIKHYLAWISCGVCIFN